MVLCNRKYNFRVENHRVVLCIEIDYGQFKEISENIKQMEVFLYAFSLWTRSVHVYQDAGT